MPLQPHELSILKSTPLFEPLSPTTSQKIIAMCVPETRPPGSLLFRQGESATSFFVIIAGWVKIIRQMPSRSSTVINVLSSGDAVAEAIAVAGGVYPASAETVTHTRTLRIDSDLIRSKIHSNPKVALALINTTATQNRGLIEDIERLKSFRALERVAAFIASLTKVREGATTVALPFDKILIAARLGIQPESLSRIFVQLRDLGVHVEKSTVSIADMGLLGSLGSA